MNSKVERPGSGADTVKLALALVVVLGGAVAFNYYSAEPLLLRVVAMIVVVAVALAIAIQTGLGRASWEFLKGSRTEVRKIVWPTRAETVQTTLVVLIMVVIVALLLWMIDSFLLWAVKSLTGTGG